MKRSFTVKEEVKGELTDGDSVGEDESSDDEEENLKMMVNMSTRRILG